MNPEYEKIVSDEFIKCDKAWMDYMNQIDLAIAADMDMMLYGKNAVIKDDAGKILEVISPLDPRFPKC